MTRVALLFCVEVVASACGTHSPGGRAVPGAKPSLSRGSELDSDRAAKGASAPADLRCPPDFAYIPAGLLKVEVDNDHERSRTEVLSAYCIGKHEATVRDYSRCVA